MSNRNLTNIYLSSFNKAVDKHVIFKKINKKYKTNWDYRITRTNINSPSRSPERSPASNSPTNSPSRSPKYQKLHKIEHFGSELQALKLVDRQLNGHFVGAKMKNTERSMQVNIAVTHIYRKMARASSVGRTYHSTTLEIRSQPVPKPGRCR